MNLVSLQGSELISPGIVVSSDPEVDQIPNKIDLFAGIKLGLVKMAKDIQRVHKMDPQLIICVVAVRHDAKVSQLTK